MEVAPARTARLSVRAWEHVEPSLLFTVVLGIVAITGLFSLVGADARWLAALGSAIAEHHAIPDGVPFAAAPTAHWPNAIVAAELLFHGLESTLGDRGLMLAQMVAVGGALSVLSRDALAGGASAPATATALIVASLGALPSLVIARVQLFSLLLFPVLVALLRSQARRPTGRIWLVVPLIAVWSNLHGAALVGLGVTALYLAVVRLRDQPLTAIGVGLAAVAAACVTPAGLRTVDYYYGVMTNVAAQRGQGLWGPLSLASPFDIMLILAALWLAVSAFKHRRVGLPGWELVTVLVLAALALHAGRGGVWLLFFLVAPAARGLRPKRTWQRLLPLAAGGALIVGTFAISRGPLAGTSDPPLVAKAVALARGAPVLAADTLAEEVALAGGRVWVSNPIDAFSRPNQGIYLDWLQGLPNGRRALTSQIAAVLVARHTPAQALMQKTRGFLPAGGDAKVVLYKRVG